MLPNFFPAQPSPQQLVGNGREKGNFLFDNWTPTGQQQQSGQFFDQQMTTPPHQHQDFYAPPPVQPTPMLQQQVITIALQYGPLKELIIVERTHDPSAFELFKFDNWALVERLYRISVCAGKRPVKWWRNSCSLRLPP